MKIYDLIRVLEQEARAVGDADIVVMGWDNRECIVPCENIVGTSVLRRVNTKDRQGVGPTVLLFIKR